MNQMVTLHLTILQSITLTITPREHSLSWFYAISCYQETSEFNFISFKLELIRVEDNSILGIIQCVPESRFCDFVPEKSIVDAASLSGHIHRDVIKSVDVSVSKCVKTVESF